VFDNDYRHPVVLAKEIATLDLVSDGRVEFGIGAGWLKSDYDQSGIAYDPPGVRVDRLEEAIGIFKALFADGKATASGRHYSVTGAQGAPRPVRRPHPPLLIGGGSRQILRLAGREADIVGVNPARTEGFVGLGAAQSSSVEAYGQKVAWVREGAGPRWDSIELQCLALFVQVTTDRDAAYANLAPMFGLTPEDVAQVPLALIGTVDQICEQLRQRREELGISYWIVHDGDIEAFALVVERLSGR
jgi:probable F420-dependent oxidoreductase